MKNIKLLPLFLLLLNATLFSQPKKIDYKKVDEYTKRAYESFDPVGVSIAIVKDGQIVYKNAFGYKNNATKEKLNTTSLFNIASCSKAFTAACIGVLVQDGKLKWTDKAVDYIPELKLDDPYITKELNIADILCHRSGLGTFDGDLLWYHTDYHDTTIIKHLKHLPIKHGFRSAFGYQNNMYMLAGEIIRRVTGKTWSEFLKEKLLQPLEMTQTRPSAEELGKEQDVAQPHIHGMKQDIVGFIGAKPAGAMFSNVEELANWTMMLMNDGKWKDKELLNPATRRMLFSDKTAIGVNPAMEKRGVHFYSYGLGWFLFDYHGKKIVEHDGGMPGYISKVTLVPEEKLAVIILNNGEEGLINSAIRYKILDLFLSGQDKDWIAEYMGYKKESAEGEMKQNEERLAKRVMNTQPSLQASGYIGIYNDDSYGKAEVSAKDGKMHLAFLPAAKTFSGEMEHWHYNTFKIKFKDDFLTFGLVTFEFNSAGETTGFKIDLPSNDFHFGELHFIKVK